MPRAPRHFPEGHLFVFPEPVRVWMLQESPGHMVEGSNSHVTVYCGTTRSSFIPERMKPNLRCRFCRQLVQDGDKELEPGGFVLWHPSS